MIERAKSWMGEARLRRRGYALGAAACALLSVLPQPYVARAKIVPQDSSSIGLNSMMNALGGQLGSFASLLGGAKQPIDMYLAVSRTPEVTDMVIGFLKLDAPQAYGSVRAARKALAHKVDIHSLTGGMIEVEVRTHDAAESERLTRAYVAAITTRLNALGNDRVQRKRGIVEKRFKEAAQRVTKAEAALNAFRQSNNLAAPEAQLGSELSLRAGLQAQLQAKLVELRTARQFQGDENPALRALQSEVAELRAQIARSAAPSTGAAGPNVAGLSQVSGRYLDLYRDYRFAQALYEVYGLLGRFADYPVIPNATGFGLFDRAVVESLRRWNEPEPFFRGMVVESGFSLALIPFDRPERAAGETKNGFRTLLSFALSGLAGSAKGLLRLPILLSAWAGNWVVFQSGQVWNEVNYSTSYARLLTIRKASPIPLLDLVPSRLVEGIEYAVPLLIRASQLIALLALAGAWLQPTALSRARIGILLLGAYLVTQSPGGYTQLFLLFLVLLEKWEGAGPRIAITCTYLLCLVGDIPIATIIEISTNGWLSGRPVTPSFGLTVGHFLRPGLIFLILWALSFDALVRIVRAHATHRPSLGMAPA
ncbi:hypothetical protein [Sphingobium yanoikuyae]|jgi:hypothetical protein|uniref:hypothetical protein n=1 Tax=Sphingobium TaxID=165695 RepID=UPI0028AC0638|nr:hypothetical protein [Sphingobium yanoikuyae]